MTIDRNARKEVYLAVQEIISEISDQVSGTDIAYDDVLAYAERTVRLAPVPFNQELLDAALKRRLARVLEDEDLSQYSTTLMVGVTSASPKNQTKLSVRMEVSRVPIP